MADKLCYRPEIDGLRAIAVIAVVVFHAGLGCPGGYVGVDIFFVVSGFLITSLIWKDLQNGDFTFANFWERRARRIAPAAAALTLAVLVTGYFLLLPADYESLGRSAVWQAAFGANIFFWRDSGYFTGAAEEKPLLHTWSLAVEEQFYFVVPVLLWVCFRYLRIRSRTGIFSVLATGCILGFTLSVYGVVRAPVATFFLLPARAWELLCGSLVVFLPSPDRLQRQGLVRELSCFVATPLLLVPMFTYSSETPFPGFAALAPCLGTALLIWSNGRSDDRVPTLVGRFLTCPPLVFVGLISYSLYLWHWPCLAFGRYVAPGDLSLALRGVLVALGFVLALLSWKYIETPFRKRSLGKTRTSMLLFAGSGLVVIGLCGTICVNGRGVPDRIPMRAKTFADAKLDRSFLNDLGIDDVREGRVVSIGTVDAKQPVLLVWGDSHAMAALPAIDALLQERGMSGRAVTHSATAPVVGWFSRAVRAGLGERSMEFNDAVFDLVRREQIPAVMLIARWSVYMRGTDEVKDQLNRALIETVRRLVQIGCKTYVLLEVPNQHFDVPRALALSALLDVDLLNLVAHPRAVGLQPEFDAATLTAIENQGGEILDPKPRFHDPLRQRLIVQHHGVPLYCDNNHLTTHGAKLVLLPFFRDQIDVKSLTSASFN